MTTTKPRVQIMVSVDTEEDNWSPTRDGISVENVRALPEHQRFLRDLGLRPTYFVNHAVLADPVAAGVISGLDEDPALEIGAHLHPWNTPPIDEPFEPRNTMMCNLPQALQRAKLGTLQQRFQAVLGRRVISFRAGRFGLGRETLGALVEEGFRVDSSVTPGFSWLESDHGPDFRGAPVRSYWLAPGTDPRASSATKEIAEVPVSAGFTRTPFEWRARAQRRLSMGLLGRLPLGGLASRLGILRNVLGAPEVSDLEDLVAMARALVRSGARHLNLVWHSPSLEPGHSPFIQDAEDLRRFRAKIEGFVRALEDFADIDPATVSEVARVQLGDPEADPRG